MERCVRNIVIPFALNFVVGFVFIDDNVRPYRDRRVRKS